MLRKIKSICFLGFFLYLFWQPSGSTPNDLDLQNPFQEIARGDTFQIALREAILTALEKNPVVMIQRLTPKIAETQVKEQRAVFDPQIALSANKNQTKLQRFLGSRPNPFEMTTDRSQYDFGIAQALPTGTTIAASAGISASLSSIYSDQFSGNVGFTINQALLQGFGIGTNLANLRQAKIDLEISHLELQAIAEEVTAALEKAYWTLYLTGEEIKIQTKSLQLAHKQLQESEERVAVGKLPNLELAAVHAEVAIRQEALIDAQSRYQQARLSFLYLLNPTDRQWGAQVPIPEDQPFVPADTLDPISIHEQLGLKFRPDLHQARLALKKGEIEITRTRNGLLPRLDLFISLGRTTYAKTFQEAIPDVHSPFYDVIGGISFSFPIPNRKARASHLRAVTSKEQQELALLNMERLVQWDVRSAYIEVLRSRQQIEATQVTRVLQEKKLEAEQEKFRVGKSTNFLVLQAQRDLTASQLDEARSMVAYLNALVDLHLVEGTLLARRGIQTANE